LIAEQTAALGRQLRKTVFALEIQYSGGLVLMDKKALILVVDDNEECRTLLVWTLERHGFRTISATCGLDAVELAIELQPRLVLMDLGMPGMNGYQATQAIHDHRRGRNIPIVAVSSYCVDRRYERWALKGGFIASLGKPWEEKALLQIVTKGLARRVVKSAESARAA
jgi:CheY-like chemotaxis protein